MKYLIQEIPFVSDWPDQRFRVSLAGQEYMIRLMWNDRGRYWSLSLYDPDGTPRLLGEKLVTGWPIACDYPQARVRYGVLILSGDNIDVPLEPEDLGSRLKLCFVTLERE